MIAGTATPRSRWALLVVLLWAHALGAQEPRIAPNAPVDHPSGSADTGALGGLDRAIAPYVAQARASYPAARARYLTGLPAQESFFVTTRLHDAANRQEQVFIAVDSIRGPEIFGRIWSKIAAVHGYHLRDAYHFPDSELIDWLITRPDGSEEGNAVGKFLDTHEIR